MKKLLLFGLAVGSFLFGKAQVVTESAVVIDAAEDTTQVNTINDIVVMQEMVNKRNITDAHYSNVWRRKSYFNPGYVSSKVTSKTDVALGNNKFGKLDFKHDWGAQIELGHSYTLHRGAIANMVQINLDYTYIDLTVNHYLQDDNFASFDSKQRWMDEPGKASTLPENTYLSEGEFYYMPWGADKWDATYGMSLGPSLTIAPFTPLNIKGLHYIKLNAFVHWGYNVGMLLMDEKAPSHNGNTSGNTEKKGLSFDYLAWGHGLTTSFGINLSWKSIGIGWETRSGDLKYKPFSTGEYGDFETKLKTTSSRVYLTIKY